MLTERLPLCCYRFARFVTAVGPGDKQKGQAVIPPPHTHTHSSTNRSAGDLSSPVPAVNWQSARLSTRKGSGTGRQIGPRSGWVKTCGPVGMTWVDPAPQIRVRRGPTTAPSLLCSGPKLQPPTRSSAKSTAKSQTLCKVH